MFDNSTDFHVANDSTHCPLRYLKCDFDPFLLIATIFPLTTFILSFFLFPLFQFVQRQNKESDASTSVYPIVKHFNYVVKKMMIVFSIFVGLFWIFILLFIVSPALSVALVIILIYIFIIVVGIPSLIMSFVPNVQYVLHFLLGLQRLLIYFFPEKEKYISWSERRLTILLVILYAIFCILDLRSIYNSIESGMKSDSHIEKNAEFQVHLIIFLFLNFLQVLGALCYIPIMRSVSKLAHLTSAAINRPQKYLFYQILILLISRIGYLPTFFVSDNNFELMMIIVAYDIILTPFVIQLAYVLCNRRNVQTLLSSPWKVIIWSLIGRSYRPPQVHPSTVIESTKI